MINRGGYMRTIRSAVLSSAAGLLALHGAQAADLPVKAKAVEYVKICSLYGAGFYYIPGTDTCLRIGGYLRADVTFNGGPHGAPAWNGDLGQGNRYRTSFAERSRLGLSIDTRTATEYGVVRTFGIADFQFTTYGGSTNNPAVLAAAPPAAVLDTAGGGYVSVEVLFLQFAGFTFGKSASAFATPWHSFLGNTTSFFLGGHDSATGTNNIQYTAQFGNGVSGTIALEDPTVYNRTAVYNLSTGVSAAGLGANAYAGTHAPDIVGNIRVDQAWGLFQLSAAAHEVSGSYNILGAGAVPTALSEISGHPETKWGGAVMAALQIKNIPTGPGDDIKFNATYAVGDTKQVISASAPSPTFAMFGGTGVAGAYQSIGLGATSDAVYLPTLFGGSGDLKLTKSWGIQGAFNHNWNPYWLTSLFGSYSSVRYDGTVGDLSTAKGAYCSAFAASHPGSGVTYTCDPNFNVAQLGVGTRWTPVKNLTFSAEVMWTHLDQKMGAGAGGVATSTFAAVAPKPAATYEFKDQNTVSLQLRAHRNF